MQAVSTSGPFGPNDGDDDTPQNPFADMGFFLQDLSRMLSGGSGGSWDAAAQQWLGYFPSGVNVPGANDLVSLKTGSAFWIAITGPSSVTWTIASNVN